MQWQVEVQDGDDVLISVPVGISLSPEQQRALRQCKTGSELIREVEVLLGGPTTIAARRIRPLLEDDWRGFIDALDGV